MPQLKPIPLTMDELQLSPDDERYADGAACVRKYWAHATQLNVWQQKQMIEHIKSHSYAVEPAGSPIQSHKLYREEMLRHQMLGLVGLTSPPYLILSAVYPKLPEEYVEAVKLAFGTYDIDAINKYFRLLGLKKKEQLATIAIKKSSPSIQRKQPASSSLAKQRQISSASSAPGNDISSPPPVLEHLPG
ncbi:hypothetical protein TrVGV298_009798 [Trichoderma virens]|nr:hypothetical protein TrVGV298_009798 [Trichoderma virens]